MKYSYEISIRGKDHEDRNLPCQDYCTVMHFDEKNILGIVADGVGSESHSDFGASIAVHALKKVLKEKFNPDMQDEEILKLLNMAFCEANETVKKCALESGYDPGQCDTTLSAAILRNNDLFYGHVGDSGIIALQSDGTICAVTKKQQDSEGRVYPLCFVEEKGVFEKFDGTVASVILATDGIFDTLTPVYLKDEKTPVYNALAMAWMDIRATDVENVGIDAVREKITDYLSEIPKEVIGDDKSLVVLMDSGVVIEYKEDEYYSEPDWEDIIKRWREDYFRKAYPHLI